MDQHVDTQTQSAETLTQKKNRTSWKDEALNKTFLEACIHEVTISGRQGTSLKPQSWIKVGEILKKKHKFEVEPRQMRNRYDYLKFRYSAWCLLKSKTGNHYDPTTNTFSFTDAEWTQHSQANSYVSTLRTAPLLCPNLCKNLYDGAAATGVGGWGPSSKKGRTIDLADDIETLESEDIPSQSHNTSPHYSKILGSNSNASNSFDGGDRPKKINKTSSKISKSSQLEDKMITALDLMVQNNNGPSHQECKEKLNKLGWGSTNT